jgi:lipopolysaccharide transport system permease protein
VNALVAHRLTYLWDLLAVLVSRDLKLRYKRSILGLAWSLLNPLAQFATLHFVFSAILPLGIASYTPFLFAGVLAWNWFSTSLLLSTNAIVDNRELIRRPGFPPAVLPLIAVISNLIHFLLALPILLVLAGATGTPLVPSLLWLPSVVLVQFLLILSVAYFLAAIQVTFRDTQYLLGIGLTLGFYLTPVFYTTSSIPEPYLAAFRLNPLTHLLEAYRTILLVGQPPNLSALMLIGLGASMLLLLGYQVFLRASYHFAEEL